MMVASARALLCSLVILLLVWASVSAASTQGQAPPVAPDFVSINGTLEWRDNSNNEDGFRIEVDIDGEVTRFEAGANSTSFIIPTELAERCGTQRFAVFAYNEAGETMWTSGPIRIVECAFSAPTPAPLLPDTGGRQAHSETPDYTLSLLAAGVGLLALGVGLAIRLRGKTE